jgi:hypothetical protein
MQRKNIGVSATPVANAKAYRFGRTHRPIPSRVMYRQMLQSPSPGPATILLRNRATSAACSFGSTHMATAGARPTRHKTVTSPDPTDDHRHQLRL